MGMELPFPDGRGCADAPTVQLVLFEAELEIETRSGNRALPCVEAVRTPPVSRWRFVLAPSHA